MTPHILTSLSLTVLLDSRSIAIPRSHANFDAIVECLADDNLDELRRLLDVKQSISDFTQGKIGIHDRILTYAGTELNTSLTSKIIEFMRAGEAKLAAPLINFLDKLMLNPSHRAVQGLYDWVAVSNMPIAVDGDIYAWKIVNEDYLDYYTGTLDHSPGNVVSQTRNMCDEDPDRTCSNGIHFCSFGYLPNYHAGDDTRRVMLVKINPMNVVAIPRDYGTAKGRCCELTVVQQVPQSELEDFFPTRTVYYPSSSSPYKVGQVWMALGGDRFEIMQIYGDGQMDLECRRSGEIFGFDDEGHSLARGDLWLVELEISTGIDWSAPLEDTEENPVEFRGFKSNAGVTVAVVDIGWYHDVNTGHHIYNNRRSIRNVQT